MQLRFALSRKSQTGLTGIRMLQHFMLGARGNKAHYYIRASHHH